MSAVILLGLLFDENSTEFWDNDICIRIEFKPQDYVIIHFALVDLVKSLLASCEWLDFEFF